MWNCGKPNGLHDRWEWVSKVGHSHSHLWGRNHIRIPILGLTRFNVAGHDIVSAFASGPLLDFHPTVYYTDSQLGTQQQYTRLFYTSDIVVLLYQFGGLIQCQINPVISIVCIILDLTYFSIFIFFFSKL